MSAQPLSSSGLQMPTAVKKKKKLAHCVVGINFTVMVAPPPPPPPPFFFFFFFYITKTI